MHCFVGAGLIFGAAFFVTLCMMKMKQYTGLVGLLLLSGTLWAQTLKGNIFATKQGAIDGYDVVAYFTQAKAMKGNKTFNTQWANATWYFTTAEHRDLFKAHPEKYAPAFGGFCAYGVAEGYKVKIDPTAWDIVDGVLYLNYDLGVQKTWRKNRAGFIDKAQKNWQGLKDQ